VLAVGWCSRWDRRLVLCAFPVVVEGGGRSADRSSGGEEDGEGVEEEEVDMIEEGDVL
jgi:hypothetical protein